MNIYAVAGGIYLRQKRLILKILKSPLGKQFNVRWLLFWPFLPIAGWHIIWVGGWGATLALQRAINPNLLRSEVGILATTEYVWVGWIVLCIWVPFVVLQNVAFLMSACYSKSIKLAFGVLYIFIPFIILSNLLLVLESPANLVLSSILFGFPLIAVVVPFFLFEQRKLLYTNVKRLTRIVRVLVPLISTLPLVYLAWFQLMPDGYILYFFDEVSSPTEWGFLYVAVNLVAALGLLSTLPKLTKLDKLLLLFVVVLPVVWTVTFLLIV